MAYKDKEKERAYAKAYQTAHRKQHCDNSKRWAEKNKEKVREYKKSYYLKNREKLREYAKKNYIFKRHKKRIILEGIVFDRNEQGFFWKAGKLWNGYFKYKKEAIKDAEEAFCL